MKPFVVAIFYLATFGVAVPSQAITIATVPIGNAGNLADTRYIDSNHPSGVGAVAYSFNIGTTEVTNAQYVAFLNAVAAFDPYGLYNSFMGSAPQGGIVRNGFNGQYTYSVEAPALGGSYTFDKKPVIYVSAGDAMRFANWLHNGQPTGTESATTTEDGAYSLNGATTNAALAAVKRNADALWWLPSENEWYKAAYYDSKTGSYFDYPTSGSSLPNNSPPSSDTGNSANFYYNNYTSGRASYSLTDVGAYTLSASPYGTFDQGGNVWEWNDTGSPSVRSIRGGSWDSTYNYLNAAATIYDPPSEQLDDIGFRVASLGVPEPTTLLLFTLWAATLTCCRMRRNATSTH